MEPGLETRVGGRTNPFGEQALEAIPTPAALLDHRGLVLVANKSWQQLGAQLGHQPPFVQVGESLLGQDGQGLHGAPSEALHELRRLLKGERPAWHVSLRTDSGAVGDLRAARSGTGALVVLDQRDHSEGDDPLDSFFELSLDMLSVCGLDGRFTRVNHAFSQTLGYPEAELLAKPFMSFVHPEDLERTAETFASVSRGEPVNGFINRYRRSDGSYRWFQWYSARPSEEGSVYAVARDVTEQKLSEERLRRSEAHLHRAQEIAHLGSFELNIAAPADSYWSPEAFRIAGRPLSAGVLPLEEAIDQYVHPEDRSRVHALVRSTIAGGKGFQFDFRIITGDGLERHVICSGGPKLDESGTVQLLVGTLQDVTDRKRSEAERQMLEAQLRQSQKLEAVGQLAGSIAHDFNNILTAIIGYADLIREQLTARADADPDVFESVTQIERSSNRATELITKLLTFSRHQDVQLRLVDLNAVVKDMLPMLRRLVRETITVQFDSDPDIGAVLADAGQMEQVLLNLVVNSKAAMPDGGTLTISTKKVHHDRQAAAQKEVREGDYVRLSVTDTGEGMSKAVLSRIFEPFFTTKPPGLGTGLGLPTVQSIVRASGGTVQVDSTEGAGTTFQIDLPAQAAHGVTPTPAGAASVPAVGHETILVCEDEPTVRNLLERILQKAGYQVLCAEDPARAVQIAKQHPGRIDLLVSDLVLPGQNGRKLAATLLQTRPELHTLFVSGHGPEEAGIPAADLLMKPFTRVSLLSHVRARLDS